MAGPFEPQGPHVGNAEQFVVGYDAAPTRQRIDRFRRLFRSRLISLGITVLVLIVLALWQPRYVDNPVAIVGYVVIISAGIAWAAITYALYRRAQRSSASLGDGPALRIDRGGVALGEDVVGWNQVVTFAVRRAGWGFTPVLEVARRDGPSVRLPLDQLQTHPATIDTAARAYSGGRFGVDLSELDN